MDHVGHASGSGHCIARVPPDVGLPLHNDGRVACIADLFQKVHVNAYFLLYPRVSRTKGKQRSCHVNGVLHSLKREEVATAENGWRGSHVG